MISNQKKRSAVRNLRQNGLDLIWVKLQTCEVMFNEYNYPFDIFYLKLLTRNLLPSNI